MTHSVIPVCLSAISALCAIKGLLSETDGKEKIRTKIRTTSRTRKINRSTKKEFDKSISKHVTKRTSL